MAVYLPTLTFAAEDGVFRYAGYEFTPDSGPSDEQVYEYARDVASTIVLRTQEEGARHDVPYAGSDVALGRVLKKANEIGAAYMARIQMAIENGDERSARVAEHLMNLWKGVMGADAVEGTCLCKGGSGSGELGSAIAAASGVHILANDLTEGLTTMADPGTVETTYPFTMDAVD